MSENRPGRHVPGHCQVFAVLLAAALASACTADFAPTYDPETASQITATYKAVTRFYMRLHHAPEGRRSYASFEAAYADVALEMKTLLWRARGQSHNAESADMARRLLEDWQDIETQHEKRDGYPEARARIDRRRLDNLLADMASVESFKRKAAG